MFSHYPAGEYKISLVNSSKVQSVHILAASRYSQELLQESLTRKWWLWSEVAAWNFTKSKFYKFNENSRFEKTRGRLVRKKNERHLVRKKREANARFASMDDPQTSDAFRNFIPSQQVNSCIRVATNCFQTIFMTYSFLSELFIFTPHDCPFVITCFCLVGSSSSRSVP